MRRLTPPFDPAARGETPAAFGRRCIPSPPHRAERRAVGTPGSGGVAPRSNTPGIAPHRAQHAHRGPRSALVAPFRRGPHGADCAPWGGGGRIAALGAMLEFHHGLLALAVTVLVSTVFTVAFAANVHAAQQVPADEQQALRARIEQRYDVVPLSGGVALRPKSPRDDVRLIEISDTIAINGVAVSGRELRERVGADADTILRLSYLDAKALGELFGPVAAEREIRPEKEAPVEPVVPPAPDRSSRRIHRSGGDRVRIFGDAVVNEGEEVTGQVVAVLGSVRVDGEVGDQVVAVLGSVDLGPHAVVHGDVVTVGGQLRRASGSQINGAVTEVSLGDLGARINAPWLDGWGPVYVFGGFRPVARLVGTTFRFVLLALAGCLALVVARRGVEGSAQRVTDDPVKTTLIGLVAWLLFLPLFVLTAIVLAISLIGIPLLLLLPFAVVVLLLMSVVGFSGTACAVGQWARRRSGIATTSGFADICLGILIILLPLLAGRVLALGGWTFSPVVFLLVATGLAVEFLAWASGFGAVLTNAFSRWQATRPVRSTPQTARPAP